MLSEPNITITLAKDQYGDYILEGSVLTFECQIVDLSQDHPKWTVSIKWTLDGNTIENRNTRVTISHGSIWRGQQNSTLKFAPVYWRDEGILSPVLLADLKCTYLFA